MKRRFAVSFVAIALIALAQAAIAQESASLDRGGVVSPSTASRLGLQRAWFTQIELDRSESRLTHLRQHVSSKLFYTVFEVKLPERVEYFTEHTLDRFGAPVGKEGAEKLAKERIRKLKLDDIKAELKTREVPEVTIYAVTDTATLHAIDGATGRTRWVTSVGNRKHPTLPPGASDKYVAVVNGSYLYVLGQKDGKLVWSRQMDQVPGAGPSLSDEHIFVPGVTGKMEVYNLEDHRRPPWYYQSTGRLLVQPTISTNSASWATDRGNLYVCAKDKLGVRFRLEARDTIVAPATYLPPNRLFAASVDGYAYCVHEFNGDILWRFSAGDPISEIPVVTRDALYIVAEDAGMYRLDHERGFEVWRAPRIDKLLAATPDRVYCLSDPSRLVVLDAKSGGLVDSLPARGIDLWYTNWQTDRVLLGTSTGVVQCLHEFGSDWPLVHNLPDPESSAKPPKTGEPPAGEPGEEPPKDPFGGGAKDPFGGGGEEPDPFGGGAGGEEAGGEKDPGGEKVPPADPFGGAEDPFGGAGGEGGGKEPAAGGAEDPFGGP